jgi:TolB-like protein
VQPTEADGSDDTPREARVAKSAATITRWALASAALVLLVGSFLWFFARPTADSMPASAAPTSATSSVPSPSVGKLRVAILPFENLSPDPAHAFFADGLHEEILSTIAQRAPSLEVISRTTMMSYRRDPPKSLAEVARELRASHLIEGSVRREAKNVRLTLQLIDARTDAHVWSQNYDRTLTDSLTLQRDVAGEVASQLSVQLVSGARSEVPPTQSLEAYDLYLKALLAGRLLNAFTPIEQFHGVENLYSRAIALDSSFVSAYARRASSRILTFAFNYDVSEEQVRRIREDIDAARRLAPRDPLVLATEASYSMWVERDLPRALTIYESAEAAGLADPLFRSGKTPVLVHSRRTDEAVRFNERITELDPGNPFVLSVSAVTLAVANRAAEALRVVDRGLELLPDDATLQLVRAQIIFAFTGRADEWRTALDRAGQTTSPATLLDQHFALLRIEHRYAELQRLLDGISAASIRVISGPTGGAFFSVGPRPTAEYRGWTALFLKDSTTAAAHGRTVLEFVAHQKETKTNAWFLQLLRAEGLTFLGQRKRAIAAAHKTLDLMPPARDAQSWVSAAQAAAGIYAWSGAHAEAVALLEELFTARAGLGAPALIARDPLYAVPLAQNPRYQALASRVEEQMRATRLR